MTGRQLDAGAGIGWKRGKKKVEGTFLSNGGDDPTVQRRELEE